jgi:tetratricopeptide (TPR) repeat protein
VRRFATNLAALVLLTCAPAQADDKAEATRLFREAMAEYDRENYDQAIESFKAAYRLTRAPELLFNIAQAYRRKGPVGCKDALDYFESYERARDDKSRGIDVEPMIAEMKRCTQSQNDAARAAAPTASPPAEGPRPTPPAPETTSAPTQPSRLGPVLALAGGGALTAAGGIALWSIAWDNDCEPRCSFELRDRLRTRSYVGYALVGVGLAAALAGGVWWILQGTGNGQRAWLAPAYGGLAFSSSFQ